MNQPLYDPAWLAARSIDRSPWKSKLAALLERGID